jgi:hypothetical protein
LTLKLISQFSGVRNNQGEQTDVWTYWEAVGTEASPAPGNMLPCSLTLGLSSRLASADLDPRKPVILFTISFPTSTPFLILPHVKYNCLRLYYFLFSAIFSSYHAF